MLQGYRDWREKEGKRHRKDLETFNRLSSKGKGLLIMLALLAFVIGLSVDWNHSPSEKRALDVAAICEEMDGVIVGQMDSQVLGCWDKVKDSSRDCPDQTDSSNHVTLWDGSNYKRAA